MTTTNHAEELDLAALMTIDEAVVRFPLFGRSELLLAMRKGQLRHWRKGRGRLVTEDWLKDYVRRQLQGGEAGSWAGERETSRDDSRSQDSGSAGSPTAIAGTGIGMTPEQAEHAASLLAQSISRKPKRSSPRSH